MKRKIFYIDDVGDSSVGIAGFQARVTIESECGELDEDFFDNDWDEYFKKDLKEHFNTGTQCEVYTKKEWDELFDDEWE